jgi:molecular chaperone GrpE (heat shock protein)
MGFCSQIRTWLWKGADPLLAGLAGQGERVETEINELKKLTRRQGIQLESLVREISAKMDTAAAAGIVKDQEGPSKSLTELAESLFHLKKTLVFSESDRTTMEAVNIVWEKLGAACEEAGLRIICECGVPYDNRVHEALDPAPVGEDPVVKSVSAPGFIHKGRVLRPARVNLSEEIVPNQTNNEVLYGE